MISASDALQQLKDGNSRFVSGKSSQNPQSLNPANYTEGQQPFAVILGCSDSRVPAEIIFDQGLGDLFVIRVAGNIAAPSQIGSIEYAVSALGTRLVVVMGHSRCGAVLATIDHIRNATRLDSPNLRSIVDMIKPGIASFVDSSDEDATDEIVEQSVRANVRAATEHILRGSDVVGELSKTGGVQIVGASYSLASGIVEFFDD